MKFRVYKLIKFITHIVNIVIVFYSEINYAFVFRTVVNQQINTSEKYHTFVTTKTREQLLAASIVLQF
jgi:hypothetical protein